jgi:hypothetical protein
LLYSGTHQTEPFFPTDDHRLHLFQRSRSLDPATVPATDKSLITLTNHQLTMRPNGFFRSGRVALIGVPLFLMLLVSFIPLKAQTPVNFSGKWEFDKAKSSPGKLDSGFEGILTRQIVQTPSKITYRDIYARKGSKDWSTTDELYNLNGKDITKKDGANSRKWSAKWSQDKKTLTLTYSEIFVEDGVSREFLIAESYALSDDGKTLTIETYSKNHVTGEKTAKSVYHKK